MFNQFHLARVIVRYLWGVAFIFLGVPICKGGPYHYYQDTLYFETKSKTWTTVSVGSDQPTARSQHSCVALGESHLALIGGFTGESLLNDVWTLDLKLAQWKRLSVTSDEKGPKACKGLKPTDFRVRTATHTSLLLHWDPLSRRGEVLVLGLCESTHPYLLSLYPDKGTLEWKKLKSFPSVSLTAHSYASFPKERNGLTVAAFGGLLSDDQSATTSGDRTYSYLRTFDII